MRAWIKVTLLILAAFALSWGGVLAYWHSADREPSSLDLALYLVVLPVALLALFWLGRKVLSMRAAVPAVAVTPAAAASATPANKPALAVLAAALCTPHGAMAEELAGAIKEQQVRANLDPELVDDDGYPVLTVRMAEAPDAGSREQIEQWLAARPIEHAVLEDEQWRALVMATNITLELAHEAGAHPHVLPGPEGHVAPLLQVVLLPGAAWEQDQRVAAAAWIAHVIGENGWPADRINVAAAQGEPLAALSQVLTGLTAKAAGAEPVLAMVLAFDSQIGEASVNRLAATGRLMVSSRPQGVIPGEGAAGVLLSDLRVQALMNPQAPLLQALWGVRDGSADTSRRPDASLLRKLTDQALMEAAVDTTALALLLSDTDHRTSRVMELMALTTDALPHLDAGTDVQSLGAACGSCGAVPLLSALVLARHHALEQGAPILCVSNADPHHRSAVLVRPPATPS